MRTLFPWALPFTLLGACADVEDHDHDPNEGEVITTVELTFSPPAGDAIVATWADPENDGSSIVDNITLDAGTSYALAVRFLNELASPAEDITAEVADEATEHQVFFTGTALDGASAFLTHAYDDADDNGAPIGLQSTVTADAAGSGTLIVTLQHMPPVDGTAVKTDDLADDVAASGLGALPGEPDASVTFLVEAP